MGRAARVHPHHGRVRRRARQRLAISVPRLQKRRRLVPQTLDCSQGENPLSMIIFVESLLSRRAGYFFWLLTTQEQSKFFFGRGCMVVVGTFVEHVCFLFNGESVWLSGPWILYSTKKTQAQGTPFENKRVHSFTGSRIRT